MFEESRSRMRGNTALGQAGGDHAARAFNVGGGEEAVVAVRDYGPGISAEHLPRLTERFYRVDVTESRAQGRTGLGLALVKHIMNRHRGRLNIESRSGEGATFTVRLPASTDQRRLRLAKTCYFSNTYIVIQTSCDVIEAKACHPS